MHIVKVSYNCPTWFYVILWNFWWKDTGLRIVCENMNVRSYKYKDNQTYNLAIMLDPNI